MNHPANCLTLLYLIAISLVSVDQLNAQLFGGGEDTKPSAEFVPQSAFIGIAAFPKQITALPDLKLFPREIVTAWGKKELGFDPMLIKEVTLVVKTIDEFPPQAEPGWAAILHFEKMQGLSGAMIEKLEEKKVGGKTVFDGSSIGSPSFMVYDESTMVVGNSAYFEELITTNGKGKLAEMFKSADVNGQLQMFVNFAPVRGSISQMLAELDGYEVPTEVNNLRLIPDLVDSIEVGVNANANQSLETRLIMHTANNDDAERIKEILVEGMAYGKTALLAAMIKEMDGDDPVQVATIAYAKRIYEKYETKYTPTVSGSDLSVVANEEILLAPFLMGMMGGMSRTSVGFKQKMTPELQLRITGLAMHNYESAHMHFPTRTIKDENGRELFGGLVSILPFIEQINLYNQLRMDEPWDSEHNSQFTSMAIENFGSDENGKSTIRLPSFPGSMWDGDEEISFGQMTDGSSNTIMAIHAPPGYATSWADPTPWKISESNPMRDVFGDRDEFVAVMCDGSIQTFKKSEMTNDKLKALLTIGGGEVVR